MTSPEQRQELMSQCARIENWFRNYAMGLRNSIEGDVIDVTRFAKSILSAPAEVPTTPAILTLDEDEFAALERAQTEPQQPTEAIKRGAELLRALSFREPTPALTTATRPQLVTWLTAWIEKYIGIQNVWPSEKAEWLARDLCDAFPSLLMQRGENAAIKEVDVSELNRQR